MKLPKEVEEVGRAISSYGFEWYLVGGALRNYNANLPIKDYDLMIFTRGGSGLADMANDLLENGYTERNLGVSDLPSDIQQTMRWSVWSVVKNYVQIDILVVRNKEWDISDAVNTFPCNASMVWQDAKGDVYDNFAYKFFTTTGKLMFSEDAPEDYVQRMKTYFDSKFPRTVSAQIGKNIPCE